MKRFIFLLDEKLYMTPLYSTKTLGWPLTNFFNREILHNSF